MCLRERDRMKKFATAPKLLVLQSSDDLCTQFAALLGEYFDVQICERPTQLFLSLNEHQFDYALVCGSFCDSNTIDWEKIIGNRFGPNSLFVTEAWLNDADLVSEARRTWQKFHSMQTTADTQSIGSQLIETAVTALNIRGHWA